jgi:hypothetical protein
MKTKVGSHEGVDIFQVNVRGNTFYKSDFVFGEALMGKSVEEVEAGEDIVFRNGRSIVDVDRDDMFRLVKMKATGQHQIKLVTRTKGLRIFAFTFG